MNGADDGPRCSLISYVVPPGLSRAPIVEPAEYIRYNVPIEGVSARPPSTSHRTAKASTAASSLPPLSPVEEGVARAGTAAQTTSSGTAKPHQTVSKSSTKPLSKNNEDPHTNHQHKSCLTKNTHLPVVPARDNLKKKTVAFGKTVNVSQTIEGTSRHSKQKQAMNESMPPKEITAANSENKENENEEPSSKNKEQASLLEILNDVKSSLDVLKARDEERADELRNIRRLVDERGKEVDVLRGMFADYIGKDCPHSSDYKLYPSTKKNAQDESRSKPNDYGNSRKRSPQPHNQYLYSPPSRNAAKGSRRDSDSEEIDGITFDEFKRLLTTNPALRQFVLDIRHEENDQRTGYADRHGRTDNSESPHWRDSPRRIQRTRQSAPEPLKRVEEVKRREPRCAKFTEKVTVERSIRCTPPELTQYSVDTRRYLEDQILEEEPEDVQSLYRPGESVSYYPERLRQLGYAGDLNDSDVEDERAERNNMTVGERRRYRRGRRTDRS